MNIQKYISDNQLFKENDKILLAVSGGVDSVVLLDMLCAIVNDKSFPFSLAIAHCNFQLRGQESDEDELFVRKLAEKYRLSFFCQKFDTQKITEENKSSIQIVARNLRYAWFHELLKQHDFQYIATAHHQNDSIETVIYNLAKGTGIAGLHGILPKNGKIIRPLLGFSKREILEYATENQLLWREDSSNATDKYSRNLIRHQLIPILQKINPNLEETFKDNILRISAVERVFKEQVKLFKEKALSIDNKNGSQILHLGIEAIRNESENLIKLHEILKDFGFNFTQTKLIINSLDKEAGKLFVSNTHTLIRDRKTLILSESKLVQTAKADLLQFSIFEKTTNFQPTTQKNIAHLDYEKASANLNLRLWEKGDTFQPIGMKGKTKKISDLLNDLKIPLHLKRQVYVVTANEQILWVVGYRIDERFKVTEKTKTIIELTILEENKNDDLSANH